MTCLNKRGCCLLRIYPSAVINVGRMLPPLILVPQKITCGAKQLLAGTFIVRPTEIFRTKRQLLIKLLKSRGLVEMDDMEAIDIVFTIHKQKVENAHGFEGAYKLSVGDSVNIVAAENTGIFYAIQTLRQLMNRKGGKVMLPRCIIQDWPAFPYREYMVDIGRNFQSIGQLKEQIKVMALYKMNRLYLHLTDNPGWRLESKMYPELQLSLALNAMLPSSLNSIFRDIPAPLEKRLVCPQ